jgi:hypothetical protein
VTSTELLELSKDCALALPLLEQDRTQAPTNVCIQIHQRPFLAGRADSEEADPSA